MCAFLQGKLKFPLILITVCLLCLQSGTAETSISEREAVERALRSHPRLMALRDALEATKARTLQAGLRPNPELSIEVEDFRFSDSPKSTSRSAESGGAKTVNQVDNNGFAGSEITVAIEQRIELGRKRARRIAFAEQSTQVALWDYEIARADTIAATRRAFIQVLAGQERVLLRQQLVDVAEKAATTVNERIRSGKVGPLEGSFADILLAQISISLTSAERELKAARAMLLAQWGASGQNFERATGQLPSDVSLPERSDLAQALAKNPELARWSAELARREEAVHVERSLAMPDLTVELGWRNAGLADSRTTSFRGTGPILGNERTSFEEDRENSFVLGFSLPLPLFDRNQGRIREAEYRVQEASNLRRASQTASTGRALHLHETLSGVLSEIRTLDEAVTPTATQAYEATRAGFELGKFPYINVLNAQRTLFEVRNQHMEALAKLHLGLVELERLLGANLDDFTVGDI